MTQHLNRSVYDLIIPALSNRITSIESKINNSFSREINTQSGNNTQTGNNTQSGTGVQPGTVSLITSLSYGAELNLDDFDIPGATSIREVFINTADGRKFKLHFQIDERMYTAYKVTGDVTYSYDSGIYTFGTNKDTPLQSYDLIIREPYDEVRVVKFGKDYIIHDGLLYDMHTRMALCVNTEIEIDGKTYYQVSGYFNDKFMYLSEYTQK